MRLVKPKFASAKISQGDHVMTKERVFNSPDVQACGAQILGGKYASSPREMIVYRNSVHLNQSRKQANAKSTAKSPNDTKTKENNALEGNVRDQLHPTDPTSLASQLSTVHIPELHQPTPCLDQARKSALRILPNVRRSTTAVPRVLRRYLFASERTPNISCEGENWLKGASVLTTAVSFEPAWVSRASTLRLLPSPA